MTDSPRFWTLIPAAGIGQRFGGDRPKQYEILAGRSVLAHTLERVSQWSGQAGILVVLGASDTFWPTLRQALPFTVLEAVGGTDRCRSVVCGLKALLAEGAKATDWVLVHDAARPGVRRKDAERLMSVCSSAGAGGLLALPARDTLQASADGETVSHTLDRRQVWQAQTPQCFPLGALLQTLTVGETATDEASAMAQAGFPVHIVEGHWHNLKLTVPDERALLEWILTHND